MLGTVQAKNKSSGFLFSTGKKKRVLVFCSVQAGFNNMQLGNTDNVIQKLMEMKILVNNEKCSCDINILD